MTKPLKLLFIGSLLLGCTSAKITDHSQHYTSETLSIQKVADHVYQHISFLSTESFGKVSCNGMVVFDEKEAVVFDTPADNNASLELINWVENELKCKIVAIIPTHFHDDCLGGLNEFHKHEVPSYAKQLTIELARSNRLIVPQNGFDKHLELKVGNKKVIAEFFGEGHTKDNIIGYLPDERALFGGCLIKEVGAGKGNLKDANTNDWPLTVAKLKEKYPDMEKVIPGHGKTGGPELLDYTIKLFRPN